MADTKISALPASTTPLAGTEVLPIVQSSATKQVSVANLTAGRAVSADSLALTTALPATSGGTGANSAFTANGVVYASSTSVLATSSALTFDGTTLITTGKLFVSATSNQFYTGFTGAGSVIRNPTTTTNTKILEVCGGTDTSVPTFAVFFNANNTAPNTANSTVQIGLMAATSRSINAAGSVNIFGADYAEYMTKAGDFTVAKGDVVGINADGKLTNVFADAISFAVKSTNPAIVGGDSWGVGFENDEQGLEQARQKVDRIAFAGQVPVNVLGATAGQYIVPINDNGAIKGEAVSNPTFEQYMAAVGKVIAVKDDGRATIIVKIS